MTKDEKIAIVEELSSKLASTPYFYITDASGMSVAQVNNFRRTCFEKGMEYKVYKNSLIKKALEQQEADFNGLYPALKGFSGILFYGESGAEPAKLLKDFYKKSGQRDKFRPALKGASIETAIYLGVDQLDALIAVKSKNELIGEVIGLLQSPAKNVVGALKSGGNKIAGILKTLSEKEG